MSGEMKITLVEEWNYYDGFRSGIVRIQHAGAWNREVNKLNEETGDLYYAEATDYHTDDTPVPCIAWSLFHKLYRAQGIDLSGAVPDPGPIHFTYADLYGFAARGSTEGPQPPKDATNE